MPKGVEFVLLLPPHTSQCWVLQAVHQSSAVLGLGLIGMAEDLGNAMAHRALEHLLQYGDTAVRSLISTCTVPALAAMNPSLLIVVGLTEGMYLMSHILT